MLVRHLCFELDDFHFKLGLAEGEYAKMANFKDRVLDAALNQINELTDIIASYEQHKKDVRLVASHLR